MTQAPGLSIQNASRNESVGFSQLVVSVRLFLLTEYFDESIVRYCILVGIDKSLKNFINSKIPFSSNLQHIKKCLKVSRLVQKLIRSFHYIDKLQHKFQIN